MGENTRALAGLRIVEMTIAIAAPTCGRAMGFHGAEVIKIESRQHPDVARLFGSAWARTDELREVFTDTSPFLPEWSTGKRSVGLELKTPGGLDMARRLIATADIFLTNYSPPAIRALGLGYEDVKALKPDLIYIAMPAFGSDPTTPYYEFISWGPNQAPLVGLDELTGQPDREPAGVASFAPPDYFAGLHAMMATLTALEHRARTGEGCCVDLAQFDTTVSALGAWVLDRDVNHTSPTRDANRVPWLAPQGLYPCKGDDEWVAITVDSDDTWVACAREIGIEEQAYTTLAERLAAHDELDALITEWTRDHTSAEVTEWLQAAGVPAYPVHDAQGVLFDPQVRDRRWFQSRTSHRFPGGDLFCTSPLRLESTPGSWERAGPSMGQDTVEVLREVAGATDEQIDELLASGIAFIAKEPEHALARPYESFLAPLGLAPTAHELGEPSA